MKTNIRFIISFALALCGCNRDLLKDIPGDVAAIYMPQAVNVPAVYTFNRSALADTIIYGACYGGLHSPASDISVRFVVDASLRDQFNSSHFTNYPLMPEGSYELMQPSAVIGAGRLNTPPLELRVHTEKLEGTGSYLLPVSIQADGNVKVNDSLRTTYFLVNARYTENPFPAFDRSSWKVAGFSSEEITGEGANNGRALHALDGDDDTFWTTQWKTAKPGPPHHIIIDMQEAKQLHGLSITGRKDSKTGEVRTTGNPRDIVVATSMDGVNWTYTEAFTLNNILVNTIYLAYAQQARFFRIVINGSQSDNYLTHIAELNAF